MMDDASHTPSVEPDPLWYKDAVIYQLHVKAFFDSNNNGYGDFAGLIAKLDYLQSLGVTALWLLPFYPSPLRDDGYDIADYHDIHPDYGTLDDFTAFVAEAHARGMRVITELVINHTSDQHPWFQAARQALPGSPEREFYVWSDSDEKFAETRIIFTDTEKSNWAWDPEAKAYYWHRFFSHQPDLNHNNPAVVDAVIDVMRFWLDTGVDGVRLDAIPYLCVKEGTNNENLPETHAVLKRMRAVLDAEYPDRCFLAEANQWPEDVRDYFGDDDECHMAYHFPLMPRMYMALAQEDRHPIIEILEQTPDIPANSQWAIFLRNHDELTLEMVTDKERDYMYQTYAANPNMRVNVGIRRRLAPLLDNSRHKIELMNSLLLSLPGTPIIYYGDELGMGDNIYLGDRNGVRTPMQWSPDRNGGFSCADPEQLYLPLIMDPVYGYQSINVEAFERSQWSLLGWMRRLIGVRRRYPAFGRGEIEFLHPDNRKILAYLRSFDGDTLLCVANLSRYPQAVALALQSRRGQVPLELLGQTPFPAIGEGEYILTLPGFGFYWFHLQTGETQGVAAADTLAARERLPVLVWFQGWHSLLPERVEGQRQALAQRTKHQLETRVLSSWLPQQRWFLGKGQPITALDFHVCQPLLQEQDRHLLGVVRVTMQHEVRKEQEVHHYQLPLAVVWENSGEAVDISAAQWLARVRYRAQLGAVIDAASDSDYVRNLIEAMATDRVLQDGEHSIRAHAYPAFSDSDRLAMLESVIDKPGELGTNTTVQIGDWGFLKIYRHLHPGASIEVEMGRFLTEEAGFAYAVPVLGSVDLTWDDSSETAPAEPLTLAMLQRRIGHQGNAWDLAVESFTRVLEQTIVAQPEEGELIEPFYHLMHLLGQRTGQLHQALQQPTVNPAFMPEPVTDQQLQTWLTGIAAEAEQSLELLAAARDQLTEADQALADGLLGAQAEIRQHFDQLRIDSTGVMKSRHHGDFHLAQVLVAEEDFIVIDFEGEPTRDIATRRSKHSALRDVAGMIRSFDYAAAVAGMKAAVNSNLDETAQAQRVAELQHHACAAFIRGYQDIELPANGNVDTLRALVEVFTLEKAFYELRYELTTRPDWVGIPLRSLTAYFIDRCPLFPESGDAAENG